MTNMLARKSLFCALCILCGWIAAFSMQPASLWPLMFVGMSGLYWLYSKTKNGPQAFAAGFLFAIGYFVTGLWWIGNALLVEGNEFAWVWPISVIGLPTLLGLFTGLFLSVARIISKPDTLKGFFCFAFFLTISEWSRGHAFTGFPWNLYGYVWADHLPMAQGYFLFGSYGMTFLTVLCASIGGYLFAVKPGYKKAAFCLLPLIASIAALYAWGSYRLSHNPTTFDEDNMVVVVQPNIEQSMKWDPAAIQDNFLKLNSLSKASPLGKTSPQSVFIVWPETAISPAVYSRPENMERVRRTLNDYDSDAYLVTGILLRHENGGDATYTNSVSMLDKSMQIQNTYSKTHLVPFGEFIPFQDWIPLTPVAAFKGFERGEGTTTVTHKNIPPFSPLVCYEIIFPDKVVSARGGAAPRWIVNVTNDGWYGRSAGPYQHFAQTRIRAIEEGMPVVRSANTGISGIIDPYGRIVESADIYQEASLISLLPRNIGKPSVFWPWMLQPLMFIGSLAWMFVGFLSLRRS